MSTQEEAPRQTAASHETVQQKENHFHHHGHTQGDSPRKSRI